MNNHCGLKELGTVDKKLGSQRNVPRRFFKEPTKFFNQGTESTKNYLLNL